MKAFQQPTSAPDLFTGPGRYSVYLSCPRFINGLFVEFVANVVALWICGWYLRRAMRDQDEEANPERQTMDPS